MLDLWSFVCCVIAIALQITINKHRELNDDKCYKHGSYCNLEMSPGKQNKIWLAIAEIYEMLCYRKIWLALFR